MTYSLDKETRSATVTIPALMPGINFFPLPYHPLYSFILTLGIVPDLHYNEKNQSAEKGKYYGAPYGTVGSDQKIVQVTGTGSAKILASV